MSDGNRPSRSRERQRHAWWRLSAVAAIVVAACRGGGNKAAPPTPAPAVTPAKVDSTPVTAKDTTPVKPTTDSAKAAAADTARKVDSKPIPKKKPAPASKDCLLETTESPPETRVTYSRISETMSNTFIGGGFVGRCQGENNRLRADSAEQFVGPGIINLFGNVVYEEPKKLQVRANHAIYFTREGRLFADGGVIATGLETGSTFSGQSMEYYRATAERPVARLVAPTRSTATLVEKDSATGKPGPPTSVTANRFEDEGDSLLFAWGDVVIQRERLVGRSDSAVFDKITEKSRLMRGARIVNSDSARRFTLNGDTIDLYSQNRQLERVIARHSGHATTDDMTLDAETIDLRLKEQQLSEAYAFGKGRARAKTPQQDVDADSLRIRMVNKVAREVHAIGGARAIGAVDSMKIKSPEKDVLRGDSIYAYFDSSDVVVKDTTKGPPVKEIRALGNASSLFHMPSSKGRDAKPAINYVRGVRIYVNFDTGSVRTVRVDSQASGIYLEPEDSTVKDSTAKRDTTAKGKAQAKPAAKPPVKPPAKPPEAPAPNSAILMPLALVVIRPRRRS